MRPKFLHPQDRISLFNLMKRALYSASKLNSRDIQKCNFFGVPSNDLFASARKAVFPAPKATGVHRLGNTWSSLWEKNLPQKGQQSFLNQSLVAPIPQSKIPGSAPGSIQMIPQNKLSSGYVQTNQDISQAATFYTNRPICVHTKPMNPLTETALFRNLFSEWFKLRPQESG